MPRRTFDLLVSWVGALLTVALLGVGILAFWGYSFANDNVVSQLKAQNIYFPPPGSEALKPANIGPYLNKYAGKQLTTGEQARAYADHFIGVHLKDVADGKTYAEVSTLSRANPKDTVLAGQVQTLFRGETLKGLLLQAYAFWQIGQLAKIGAIAAFALAGIMGLMTGLGFWHLRKVAPEEEIFPAHALPAH